jgi:hypothetical protein
MVAVASLARASAWLMTAWFTSSKDSHALVVSSPVTIASFDRMSSHSSWMKVAVRTRPLIGETGIIWMPWMQCFSALNHVA